MHRVLLDQRYLRFHLFIDQLYLRFHLFVDQPYLRFHLFIGQLAALLVQTPGFFEKQLAQSFEDRALRSLDVEVNAERPLAEPQGVAKRIHPAAVPVLGVDHLPGFQIEHAVRSTGVQ